MKKIVKYLELVSILMLCSLLAMSATAQLADSPWPTGHHDINRTGLSPYIGPDTNTTKWISVEVGPCGLDYPEGPAIGPDGTIYVPATDNYLYALYPNGTQKWKFFGPAGGKFSATPTIDENGIIYVGNWNHHVLAIYPNGTQKWSFPTNGSVSRSVAIDSEGIVYGIGATGALYAIYPNGTEKWNFTFNTGTTSAPAIDESRNILYFTTSDDKKLHAINRSDGTEVWNRTLGSSVSAVAIGADGTVYIGGALTGRTLYAIYPNGTEKWSYTTGDDIRYTTPAIGPDGTIYIGSRDHKFYALYPNGTVKWTYNGVSTFYPYSSPAIDSEGTIYVGSYYGDFYAFYPNGTVKWTYKLGGNIKFGSGPAIDSDGTIYIGADNSKLYAFGPGQAPPEPPYLATYTISNRTITPPQTTEIDVEFSETVSYKIAIEKDNATIYDWTGTAKNPAPKIWNGTYEANGSAVPDGDYRVNVTSTSTATGLSVINNTEIITVTGAKPDLIPTAVWDNQGKGGFLFANETNDITVRINNTGSGDAGAFNVTLEIDSYTETKSVASLAAGANINVTFTGYAPTTPGSKLVNVTADRENAVAESNEANNLLSTSRQVYNNGYKGKRWTGGADIATVETYSIKGNVSYSTGSSAYTGANWNNISASWSSANLMIPPTATVLSAKLYVYYNFDATGGALWGDNTTFNSVSYPKAGASHYSDVKGWGLYSDRTYGTLVYNVTSNFNKSGNTVSLGDGSTTRNVAIDGMILQVVYSDSSEPVRKIWINEGFDLLMADITKGTDTNETIAYAPFTGTVEPANISSARLIAIAPGAGDSTGNKSNVLFNSHSHRDALPPYKGATQIGIADLNVTSELGASNTAAIQDNGDSGGMRAATTILAVEYKPAVYIPKPANASVSLGASIRAAIAIEVTPSSMDFGELAPGQTSGGKNLTVKNKGGYSIDVSAEVTDNSTENLFVNGALLNDKLWSLYSAVIPKSGNDKPVAKLHVPEDYAGAGSKEGTLMFWAKKA